MACEGGIELSRIANSLLTGVANLGYGATGGDTSEIAMAGAPSDRPRAVCGGRQRRPEGMRSRQQPADTNRRSRNGSRGTWTPTTLPSADF